MVEQLLARVAELETMLVQRDQRIAELERQVGADSANSSRPPSSDAPVGEEAGEEALVADEVGA